MAEAANNQPAQQNFAIQRIFLKDVSFEAPNSPEMFQQEWNPDVNLDLDTQSRELGQGVYEVVLRLTVTVKNGEDNAFLCEVQQGGIFTVDGMEAPQLAHCWVHSARTSCSHTRAKPFQAWLLRYFPTTEPGTSKL